MKAYRVQPIDGLGRALVILLAVDGALSLINGVINFAFWRTERFVIDVSGRPWATGDPFGSWPQPRGSGVGAIGSLVGITVVVVWLIWQHHATANLWARGYGGLRTTPGWAVGWWFVPFANLAMPFLAMRELDRRSTPDGHERRTGAWLGWWWATYLVATLGPAAVIAVAFLRPMARWFDAIERGAGTVDLTPVLRELAVWTLVGSLLRAVAAIMAMMVVQRVTRAQEGVMRRPLPPRPDIALA